MANNDDSKSREALGTGPQLLLLDEPAAGTNPNEKQELERAHPQDW